MCIRHRTACGSRRWIAIGWLFSLGLFFGSVPRIHAAAAAAASAAGAAAAAATAAPAVSTAGKLLHDVAEIPLATADIVKLPMGVVECVFAPLPGVEFKSGLSHIGTGLLGPFRLVIAVLTLPADIANAATGAGNAMAGKK